MSVDKRVQGSGSQSRGFWDIESQDYQVETSYPGMQTHSMALIELYVTLTPNLKKMEIQLDPFHLLIHREHRAHTIVRRVGRIINAKNTKDNSILFI